MDIQHYYNDINNQIKELKEANKILEESNKKHEQDKIIANAQIKELQEKNKYLEEKIILMEKNFDFLKQKIEQLEIKFNKPNEISEANNNKEPNIIEGKEKQKNILIEKKKKKLMLKKIEEKSKDMDDYYPKIELKLKDNIKLSEKEEIYLKIYTYCKKELGDDNFSLSKFKKDHTSNKASIITNIFHNALKNLTAQQRKIFFDSYDFKKCMSECWSLTQE